MSLPFPSPPNLSMSARRPTPPHPVSYLQISDGLLCCVRKNEPKKKTFKFFREMRRFKVAFVKNPPSCLPACLPAMSVPTPPSPPLLVCSGGLAERLSRLQNRQRSAVSFWRHESLSDSTVETGEVDRQLAISTLNTQVFTFPHISITAIDVQQ